MRTAKRRDITPEVLFINRRRFVRGLGVLAAAAVTACARRPAPAVSPTAGVSPTAVTGTVTPATPAQPAASAETDELGTPLTTFSAAIHYNNYYELGLDKEGLDVLTGGFRASPWSVAVGGLVDKPRSFIMEDLLSLGQEERIYRMRCVEGWSMVLPWMGFPLARLLEAVAPQAEARYVRFETLHDAQQLPGQRSTLFEWPYVEGLRLDEAWHDLTLLATGLYSKPLTVQNGAPIRLVVPWKYGFKSVKSVVKIDLVAEQPTSFWMAQSPQEYGFYANVNPDVPHPRWSQASERLIGDVHRRPTVLFNGYGDQVASLYEGMDLRENF
jgi:sulfoxide reductase catalytic subunit YedY